MKPSPSAAALRRQRSALKKAVSAVGGQTALARLLGPAFKQQHVNNWLTRSQVPLAACPLIERATEGAVKCEALRPDVGWVRDRRGRITKYEVLLQAVA